MIIKFIQHRILITDNAILYFDGVGNLVWLQEVNIICNFTSVADHYSPLTMLRTSLLKIPIL